MSHLNRVVGILRSLAMYHAIPLRQPRLRRLYTGFVSSGDLVFDVGAHAGNRTRAFSALGCRVVALEPQPDFARLLRTLFGRSDQVEVLETAVGDTVESVGLSVSERTPTLTTLSTEWREARAREPLFKDIHWNPSIDVESTTLDALIERFGRPAFVKIDVEGAEPQVLAGLSYPLRALSFEYLPWALDYTRICIAHVERLGSYRFNWSPGESYRLAASKWLTGQELSDRLQRADAQSVSGDVYARLESEGV
jgi:FkbM family methyltransferase